ncbi:MAG: hypothetical protein NZ805_01000 [Armatimonadetes bacterium]|nr:hypothetical protein [Armatimonadota bacterium]MDW8027629.1 hypothetical protein [Armatimonadota bacterium]
MRKLRRELARLEDEQRQLQELLDEIEILERESVDLKLQHF